MRPSHEILKAGRRARWKNFFHQSLVITILAVFFLLFGGWYLWNTPNFALTNISIVGNETIPTKQLMATTDSVLAGRYFSFFSRRVNWFYPRTVLAETLKRQFRGLAVVNITNPSLGTLQVSVEERHPTALWCQVDDCYFIDSTGRLYSRAPEFSNSPLLTLTGSLLPIPLNSRPLPLSQFRKLLDLQTAINQLLQITSGFTSQVVTAVELSEPVDYVFEIRDVRLEQNGWRLLVARRESVATTISRLSTTFSSPAFLAEYRSSGTTLESLDLRFKRKIFYKFMS